MNLFCKGKLLMLKLGSRTVFKRSKLLVVCNETNKNSNRICACWNVSAFVNGIFSKEIKNVHEMYRRRQLFTLESLGISWDKIHIPKNSRENHLNQLLSNKCYRHTYFPKKEFTMRKKKNNIVFTDNTAKKSTMKPKWNVRKRRKKPQKMQRISYCASEINKLCQITFSRCSFDSYKTVPAESDVNGWKTVFEMEIWPIRSLQIYICMHG